MNPWYHFRKWLHKRGYHLFCREVDILDHIDTDRELIATKKADGTLEFDDVSVFGGRRVYRKGHG